MIVESLTGEASESSNDLPPQAARIIEQFG
jgi:hypothetical protein